MRLLLAFLLFAFPANAATYRIDVTGSYSLVWLLDATYRVDLTSVYSGPVDVTAGQIQSDLVTALPGYAFLYDGAGSARWNGTGYSGCNGVLLPLCSGDIVSFDPYTSGDLSQLFRLRDTSISFQDDSTFSFDSGGTTYFSTGGVSGQGTVSNLSVSQVPLPASVLLLAIALVPLLRFRRQHG